MKKRFIFLAVLLILSSVLIPVSANGDGNGIDIDVAVCYDPREIALLFQGVIDPIDYLCNTILSDFNAVPVRYEDIVDTTTGNGLIQYNDGQIIRLYDVAYFYGGYMIILFRPKGFDDVLRDFARAGGGIIGHCGAAAVFSEGFRVMSFIKLPGIGLLPFEAETSLMFLFNLLIRTLRTGFIDLAPVTVSFLESNELGYKEGLYTFAWDGGVAFPRFPGEDVTVCARVTEYPVSQLINIRMKYRAFFVAGNFEGNPEQGKIILCPGSPEFSALASQILGAEINYVNPK